MKGYDNDCVLIIKNRLRKIPFYNQYIQNTKADIEEIKCRLNSIPVAVSRYGIDNVRGSGSDGLIGVEAEAEQRIKLQNRLRTLEYNLTEAESLLSKLNAGIEMLNDDEQVIIRSVFEEGVSFSNLQDKVNMSERTCRRICREAVQKVAITIFGPAAQEDIFQVKVIQ